LSQTIYATGPLLEGLAGFLGEGLPATLRSTQSTVTAAAESARIVDTVLETLAAIPFINFSYAPQTPLSETLGNVAGTLSTLPDGLEALGTDLAGTGGTLPDLARSLDAFGASIGEVDESLASAQRIVASYQSLIGDYQAMIAALERLIPVLVSVVPATLTFVIFWLAVVQIAALMVGWRWARGGQTLGMRVAGIRVVSDRDGSRIGWGAAILRLIGWWVSAAVLYIGFVWILIDSRRRGWHDLIAGTCVISAR
jgi:hypothetical protein